MTWFQEKTEKLQGKGVYIKPWRRNEMLITART